ncbi:hypothetical protein KFK09_024016 [Dendrobium nobile]|uniref:DUF3730 domain-containing protein n=1 Tax=Dendrobium nobile TaxID=94219 RepID=A0A8T3ACL0_DENNO|nr:hypothetical protein KFK09_024016 [Dendrobium nobile]
MKALGLHSLSSLCEADVVDFYTAWEVVAKHVNTYTEEPVVAAGLSLYCDGRALDVETYPDIARIIMLILWEVGTLRSYSSRCLWVKARTIAFQSIMYYELNLLEMLPSLASNSAMVKIIVQTILPMLHKNIKLYAPC